MTHRDIVTPTFTRVKIAFSGYACQPGCVASASMLFSVPLPPARPALADHALSLRPCPCAEHLYRTSDLTCWLSSSSKVQLSLCSNSNMGFFTTMEFRSGHLYFLYLIHSYSLSVTGPQHTSPSFLVVLPTTQGSTWNSEFIHRLGLPASWCPARDFNGKEKGERNNWWEIKTQNYLSYYIYNLGPIWPMF